MEASQPRAEAIAIAGGEILAVGTKTDVMAHAGPTTQHLDLAGRTVLPGFIDAHGHFANALQVVGWANIQRPPAGPVTSIADLLQVLREHVLRHPVANGEWVIAYGYDPDGFSDGRPLDKADLDALFPENPVMVIHNSNHGAVLNSCALALAGYDASTPDPAGGVIVRRPGSTEPAGLVMETAFIPLFLHMPQPSEEQRLEQFETAQRLYTAKGITTVQDGATVAADLGLFQRAAREGRLCVDLVLLPLVLDVPSMLRERFPDFHGQPLELPQPAREAFGHYRDRLKLQGIKLLVDGSPQGKTAFWGEPLLTPGPNGEANWRGQPVCAPEQLMEAVAQLSAQGIQLFSHCNGDAAIDLMIEACRRAGLRPEQDHRTVIIHSQFMAPGQLEQYVELGLHPSFFTVHAFFYGDVHLANLGPERAGRMSSMASAMALGLHCSNHNDFSVTPIEPMRMVETAMTRRTRTGVVLGASECVSAEAALRALTIEAAWQIREETSKGSLAPGKRADLVILDADPTALAPEQLNGIAVVATLKDGVCVYGSLDGGQA
ncbi:amidohydrolase [Synechococcus sp. WH 8101]|uniref:amidohydrolase n=1 Tax=Synechococcus sp. WH 8101 TaxID=59932 RepID=UPI0020C36C70|nr:amidohydrolase [Synechococcus sp. WH 8101]